MHPKRSVEFHLLIFKNKTKIWMVLEGLSLTYYKDDKRVFCVGSVDVRDVQTARQTGKKQGREFEINTKSTLYSFTAETDELAEAWVIALQQSMLQKSPARNTDSSDMSSDYASISDVMPARETNARSRVYEEIAEIQGSGEKNIFGIKLRPSMHRAQPPPIPEHPKDEPATQKSNPPMSSFKPVPKSPVPTSPVTPPSVNNTAPVEPIYAKPDKHLTKPSSNAKGPTRQTATSVKRFNKPPPSFAPPPPPGSVIERPEKDTVKPPEPQYADPSSDSRGTVTDEATDKLAQSEYAQIGDVTLTDSKKDADTDSGSTSSGEHVYYMADSVARPKQDDKDASTHDKDNSSVMEVSDATSLCDSDGQMNARTPTESKPATPDMCVSTSSESKPATSDIDVRTSTESKPATSDIDVRTSTESKAATTDTDSEVDLSQVVRRKRGSHVTTSFSEESLSSNDSAELVPSRGRNSSVNRRTTLSKQSNEDIVEETYENIPSAKSTDETYMNTPAQPEEKYENIEVFENETEQDCQATQATFEESSYGKALESVIGSMGAYIEDSDTVLKPTDNGGAFTNLKTFLERNSHDGFNLELHRVSCRNSVEKLNGLLM